MPYVHGIVIPVQRKKLRAYRAMSRKFGKVCREHGALEYHESAADDVKVGKVTSFPRAVKLKANETVVFAWVVYKSRAARDRATKKIMNDKRVASMMNPKSAGFDGKRLIYGGFKTFIDL
jgi:uncharacterized protein YbaA (DUF1428 family)